MNHLFLLLLSAFAIVLGAAVLYSFLRSKQRSGVEWQGLVARLAIVDRDAIERIASAHNEQGMAPTESDSVTWFREVGWRGLDDLQNNCAVMIDMAHYVQSRYPEAVVVAEELRLTARQIEWHLNRIRLAAQAGHLETCFAEYGSRAIGLYFGMTETVKILYRTLGTPEVQQLEALL